MDTTRNLIKCGTVYPSEFWNDCICTSISDLWIGQKSRVPRKYFERNRKDGKNFIWNNTRFQIFRCCHQRDYEVGFKITVLFTSLATLKIDTNKRLYSPVPMNMRYCQGRDRKYFKELQNAFSAVPGDMSGLRTTLSAKNQASYIRNDNGWWKYHCWKRHNSHLVESLLPSQSRFLFRTDEWVLNHLIMDLACALQTGCSSRGKG